MVRPFVFFESTIIDDFVSAWVDEVRRGLKACTVFLWYPLYWLTCKFIDSCFLAKRKLILRRADNQINNNLTSQAAVMNTAGVPNDLLSNRQSILEFTFYDSFASDTDAAQSTRSRSSCSSPSSTKSSTLSSLDETSDSPPSRRSLSVSLPPRLR